MRSEESTIFDGARGNTVKYKIFSSFDEYVAQKKVENLEATLREFVNE